LLAVYISEERLCQRQVPRPKIAISGGGTS
jgi:hypothetical protein